jgi:hypothetical protein
VTERVQEYFTVEESSGVLVIVKFKTVRYNSGGSTRIGTRRTEEYRRWACEDLTCDLKTLCVILRVYNPVKLCYKCTKSGGDSLKRLALSDL